MASENHLTPDLVFDLLSSDRRRITLSQLRKRDGPMTVSRLAELAAAREYDTDVESLTRTQRKRVYVSLYQTHVPKMVDVGVLDYDPETGEVRLTERAREIDSYLHGEVESDYPWQLHYLTLALVGTALFVLWLGEVRVFGVLSPTVLGSLVIAAFGVSVGVHVFRWRTRYQPLPPEFDA